jgi:hypothetical protein
MRHVRAVCWLAPLVFGLAAAGAAAQEEAEDAGRSVRPEIDWSLEAKMHFRDSDEERFPLRILALPPEIQDQELATVDPGSHIEPSTVTLHLDATWGESLAAGLKLDFIDLYDRNPTSTDKEWDVDEAWLRLGREAEPALVPEDPGGYLKVGKFPKFERQDDRHLESYGVVSTAFNRFEDVGVEVGVDLGRYAYVKASVTQGNPLFMRDPNALAGDNGLRDQILGLRTPELGSGFVIPYDAEGEDLDTDGDAQLGAGVGLRFGRPGGEDGMEILVFGRRRDLAETVEFDGTLYGGDLDLLRGPANLFPFPITGNEKEEVGGNVWLYLGGFTLFAQYVDQDLAGLGRTGAEAELAWRFELPVGAAIGGRQLFPSIQPAVRWSRLDPDFLPPAGGPTPSFAWEWEKIDWGLRLAIVRGIDLTAEFSDHTITLVSGAQRSEDELLVTLRWRT